MHIKSNGSSKYQYDIYELSRNIHEEVSNRIILLPDSFSNWTTRLKRNSHRLDGLYSIKLKRQKYVKYHTIKNITIII